MNIKKKSFGFYLVALFIITSVLISLSINIDAAWAKEDDIIYKVEDIADFIQQNQEVESEEIINDFYGNDFKLYEISPIGYAIYSVKEYSSIFIEGSYEVHSPYYKYMQNQKYYGGPGEYYVITDNRIKNIISDKYIDKDNVVSEYCVASSFYEEQTIEVQSSFPSTPTPGKTETDTSGFTLIKNHNYFENLTEFPENEKGTCGLVGICMLLGYLDTFVDSRYITNDNYKNGNGTTQAFHDFLFDKCMYTVLGLGGSDGYPMAGYELKQTTRYYINNYCDKVIYDRSYHEYGSITYTHSTPRTHINAGIPTLICMTKFNHNIEFEDGSNKEKYHVAVAYGYDSNDRFLVHMGWWSGELYGTKVIVSNATIHSYYTIDYRV